MYTSCGNSGGIGVATGASKLRRGRRAAGATAGCCLFRGTSVKRGLGLVSKEASYTSVKRGLYWRQKRPILESKDAYTSVKGGLY